MTVRSSLPCKQSKFAHGARISFLSAALCVSALSAFDGWRLKLNAEFAEAQRAAEDLFTQFRNPLVADKRRLLLLAASCTNARVRLE